MSDSEESAGPDSLEETVDSLVTYQKGILRNRDVIEGAFQTLRHEDIQEVAELGDNIISALLPEYEYEEAQYVKNTILLAIFNINSGILQEITKQADGEDESDLRNIARFIITLGNEYTQDITKVISRKNVGKNFMSGMETEYVLRDQNPVLRHDIRVAYEKDFRIDCDVDMNAMLIGEFVDSHLELLNTFPEDVTQMNPTQAKGLIRSLSKLKSELEERLPDESQTDDSDI